MPARALTVCPVSGCPEITTGGRCAGCKSKAEKARGSGGARGSTRRWQRFAKAYLAKHPVCECTAPWCVQADEQSHKPAQCGKPSTDPDHKDGTGRNGPRAYDETNLTALCHGCHARKTAHMDGGFGR